MFTTPKVLQSVNLADGRWQKVLLNVLTMLQTSNSRDPPLPVDSPVHPSHTSLSRR